MLQYLVRNLATEYKLRRKIMAQKELTNIACSVAAEGIVLA